MKRSLLFLLLLALFMPWAAQAQNELTVYEDGTNSNGYVPFYGLYADTQGAASECVIPSDELSEMAGGTITAMKFYLTTPAAEAWTGTHQVYLGEINETTLTGITGPDAFSVVLTGQFDATGTELILEFDEPYTYEGGNLLIGTYVSVAGNWKSASFTGVNQEENTGWYRSSATASGTAVKFLPKTTFTYTGGGTIACAKPKNLAVEYNGGTTATVTWTGDASQYNIDVNGTVTNNVTSPYTLTGLNLATTYQVKVQANCGGGDLSDWTSPKSFATDICMSEDQCNLTFVLTDTYGDGWNGNAIQVKDVATGIVIATLANQNLDGTTGEETQTATLAVCDGRELEFSWVAGSYPTETQYTVTDINDEVVLEGSGAFDTFTLNVSCTPVTCARPTDLAVNYEGDLTAEVTWSGDATTYNIDVNGTVTTGVTSPYTLSGLELATSYSVMVQANCGSDGLSNWTSPVSFTTDDCMSSEMIAVNYTLTDSYGDGWNGNYILVVDGSCNIVESLTIESGSTLEGTVKVCGSYVQFLWYAGSYPGETSWEFTDADGNVLFSGTGSTDMATYDEIYTIDSSPYPAPSYITVSDIGPYGATIGWTENGTATAWEIMLNEDETNIIPADSNPFTVTGLDPETEYFVQVRSTGSAGTSMWPCVGTSFTTLEGCSAPELTVTPYPFSADVDWFDWEGSYDLDWCLAPTSKDGGIWMQYENGTVTANIGSSTSSEQTWGVMYPNAMIQGNKSLTKVAFYVNPTYHTNDFTINIYQGDDPISGTLLGTQTATPATTAGMMEVELTSPITINPLQNLWITLTTTGTYVKTGANVSDPNAQWVLSNGEWVSVASLNSDLAAYGWMIRGYVEGYNALDFDWTSETGVTPPYTINGLDAQTQYVVRVKATCGDAWTWYYFTTPSACDAPINLEATDITYNSATLNWIGYQDGYGIRYREAVKYIPVWEEDFESDLSEWTVIAGTNAGVPGTAAWYTYDPTGGLSFEAHSGSYCASSWSWTNNVAYQANNWLITPQLDLQGILKYYVRTNDGYPDKYEVLLSTTTADTTSFTISLVDYASAPATGAWEEVIVDLSAYEGQQGYIAIHHFDYDANYLLIDDFGIYSVIEAGDWMEEDTRDNTLEITDLTPGTDYEWQVRGENDECTGGEEDGYTEWSEIANFTTEGLPTQTIELAAGWNWVSINKEITMDELRSAIIAANPGARPVIKSKGNGQTTYTGVMWSGALASLDLSQMYMIKVANACTLTLQGLPIDAAAHPATINTGANWIAYPFDVEMTIEDAFNSFATVRDVVKSKSDGQATKLAAMWSGALKKLEPGKGYVYNSKKTTSATFTFPTPTSRSASKAAVTTDPAFNRTIPCIDMYK